jgi:hypothetical protein
MTTSTMTCNFSDGDVSVFLVILRSGHSRSYNRWWLWCPMPKTDRKFVHFFFLLLFTKLQKYFTIQKWNAFLNHCRSPKHKMQCCHFSMPTSKSHFLHLLKFIWSKNVKNNVKLTSIWVRLIQTLRVQECFSIKSCYKLRF